MKDSRERKQEAQLHEAEEQLSAMLATLLPGVVQSGGMLFFNSENTPPEIQPHLLPEESEQLLDLAQASVSLREELGQEVRGTVGELFLSACSEAADSGNAQRRGPRQLAASLLEEMSAPSPARGPRS